MASYHLDDMMLIWIQDLAWINMVNAGHVGGYNLAKKKTKKKLILDRDMQKTSKTSSDIFCYLTISGKNVGLLLLLL